MTIGNGKDMEEQMTLNAMISKSKARLSFITVLLVIPSKKESGTGVCNSPFLSIKKILAPVASAIFPS